MTDLYLIAHIARGQATFDIAERADIDGEDAWILSTCGYRAYPYWHIALVDCIYSPENNVALYIHLENHSAPPNAIDCFACNDRPSASAIATGAKALLARLGLVKKQAPIVRRL